MPQDTPHASWPELAGDEMISGGDMSNAGAWEQPSGSAIAAGKMNWTAVAAGDGAINEGTPGSAFIANVRYRTSFDLSGILGGEVSVGIGEDQGQSWGGNGTNLSEVLTAAEPLTDGFRIFNSSGSAATLALDNVSCKSFDGMGQEASWAFTGIAGWASDGGVNTGIFLDGAVETDIASLTGGSKTAFDAANSANTACSYTVYVTSYGGATSFDIRARGGSWVNVPVAGAGDNIIPVSLTTGSGSGFDIRGNTNGGPGTAALVVYLVRDTLA